MLCFHCEVRQLEYPTLLSRLQQPIGRLYVFGDHQDPFALAELGSVPEIQSLRALCVDRRLPWSASRQVHSSSRLARLEWHLLRLGQHWPSHPPNLVELAPPGCALVTQGRQS